jgi:hypothetical protein
MKGKKHEHHGKERSHHEPRSSSHRTEASRGGGIKRRDLESIHGAAMLINLLDHPPKPNAALVKAFERFQQWEIENGSMPR